MSIKEEVEYIIESSGCVLVATKFGEERFTTPESANEYIMSLPEGTSVDVF